MLEYLFIPVSVLHAKNFITSPGLIDILTVLDAVTGPVVDWSDHIAIVVEPISSLMHPVCIPEPPLYYRRIIYLESHI